MAAFSPFELERIPLNDQFMSWDEMIVSPYDKDNVDAYTRTRVILMNGIENNAVLTSHAIARFTENNEIKHELADIRRVDSQQQQAVNWLNPANQTVVETTIGYEQVAVDLTANLAKNESDGYFHQVLDFALLEDFDHLFRYGCLMELLEGKDPNTITQGKTEIKPGRPTVVHHRHPNESMRKHYNKDTASLKTKMNYWTIVSGEQQTELFYKSHGFMYDDELARKLYAEIADVEEEHVSQYENVGDPRETPLEKLAMLQLHEAYNYYSCAETESDPRIRNIWNRFCAMEIEHFMRIANLIQKYEKRDIHDVLKTDTIEPLIVFEENKDYVNHVLDTQIQLEPINMDFKPYTELPSDWSSFDYRKKVNAGMIPSEDVVNRAQGQGKMPKAA
ncbi:MAG TPA: hypothetical protein VHV83_09715 [Armatimonadota bacterium]|nr:hypothetical protein [Armatimonadota bacterium]